MKKNAKKIIYILSSIALSVVVFLAGIVFIKSPNFESSAQTQNSGGNTQTGNGSNGHEGVGSTDGGGAGTGNGGIGGSGGSASGSGAGSGSGDGGSGSGANGSGNGAGGGAGAGDVGAGDADSVLKENYFFRVLSEKTEKIYLREENKGGYTGKGTHGFSDGYAYSLDNNEIDPNEYMAYALQQSGAESHMVELEIKIELPRLFPYYQNKIYESDMGIMQYAARTYAYTYSSTLKNDVTAFSAISAQYAAWENEYYKFVKDKYLSIPQTLKETLLGLAAKKGLSASSPNVISQVASYIQNAAYYDDTYLKADYPADKDMVTYFLTEHKRGVCRHFAAAATMMFRALGIPARYTTGFAVDVNANEWLIYGDTPDEQGHAWTEVYMQDYGWVAIEVTGSNKADPNDDLVVEQKYNVKVKTPNATKVYDGKPLEDTDISYEIEGNPEGVQVLVLKRASLTDVGSISNKIEIKLVDESGKECTGEITYEYGTLTITPRTLTIKTGSKTATGVDSLQCETYTVEGLAEGDVIKVVGLQFATQNGPGVCSNTISYTSLHIYSSSNSNQSDIKKNYIIQVEYGVLIIY